MEQIQPLIIRPINDGDSLKELTDLLHRAYAPLAAMGFKFLASHQPVEETRKRVTTGACVIAELEAKLAGTITWYRGRPDWEDGPVLYRRLDVARFGQFGVDPALQRRGIGLRLLQRVQEDARKAGCVELALDTAEGALHLLRWYEQLGFHRVEYAQWEVTNYRSVIMSKALN